MPLLASKSKCEQTINDDKIISEVTCVESHRFRPFSKGESGAVTEITTSLRFQRVMSRIQETQGE